MFLRFEVPYGTGKAYAKLPAGEYSYSDAQGLYEWRRVAVAGVDPLLNPDGTMLVRIHYTGGDRQGSSDGRMWTQGPESPGRVLPYPHELGFHAAVHPARMN